MDSSKTQIEKLLSDKSYSNILKVISEYKSYKHYICKILECKSFEEIYKRYNDYKCECKYCGEKTNFVSIEKGYSDICANDKCKKLKLSESVKLSYSKMSLSDKEAKSEKISKSLTGTKATETSKEMLLQLYPYLKEDMTSFEFKTFYEENKNKTTHITSAAKIFWNCNSRKELYNKFYGIKYCEVCSKEAIFYEKGMTYKKTCSQECSKKLMTKTKASKL